MTITATDAGKKLILWPPNAARIRSDWETGLALLMTVFGHERVHTPHVCRAALIDRFGDFLDYRNRLKVVVNASSDDSRSEDSANYEYLPPKNPMHAHILAGTKHLTHRLLPLRVFEIGEGYSLDRQGFVQNAPVLWTTALCHPEHALEVHRLIEANITANLASLPMKVADYAVRTIPPCGFASFTDTDNKPRDAALVFAFASFDLPEGS